MDAPANGALESRTAPQQLFDAETTEGVSAVEIERDVFFLVEIFVATEAIHCCCLLKESYQFKYARRQFDGTSFYSQ